MKTYYYIIGTFLVTFFAGCSDEWLEVKRDRSVIVPTTLKDLSLLLNDATTLTNDHVALGEISSDDYVLDADTWQSLPTVIERNAYVWRPNIFEETASVPDWDKSYTQIMTVNVVLEALGKIEKQPSNALEWARISGEAHAIRGRAFYNLAQIFAPQYDGSFNKEDAGIPLRLSPDVNTPTVRSSLEDTYKQIIKDLLTAVDLLPDLPENKLRPSRASVLGLLARCNLSMQDYDNAWLYANEALELSNTLLDYNNLDTTALFPFPLYNDEVVQHCLINPLYTVFSYSAKNYVDADLYDSYDVHDLRRSLFFHHLGDGRYSFKGFYSGSSIPFSGIAVDELLLIRAECSARKNDPAGAMNDLNQLLVKRFKKGTFETLLASDAGDALAKVLTERRKELIKRGIRWSDLKRLNKEPGNAKTLTRNLNDTEFILLPNDPRYVLPIPEYVIRISGIEQNKR